MSSQEGLQPIRINFGWDCEHVRDKEGLDYVGWEVLEDLGTEIIREKGI